MGEGEREEKGVDLYKKISHQTKVARSSSLPPAALRRLLVVTQLTSTSGPCSEALFTSPTADGRTWLPLLRSGVEIEGPPDQNSPK